jgi:hypothetical protein
MANYKELEGFGVQTLATDPDTPGWVGSIFYNSTSGTFKVVKPGGAPIGTWASGNNLNTARSWLGGAGTQTAALAFGGSTPSYTAATESYNGTSWTNVASLNTATFYLQSAGITNTAALAIGGHRPSTSTAFVESWNGSSWTEITDLNAPRSFGGSSGSSTLALIYGGLDNTYPPQTVNTESWDGSAWTEVGNLNTAREGNAGIGNLNNLSALSVGGGGPSPTANLSTEEWNGTSWTEIAETNATKAGATGFGTITAGIVTGGDPFSVNTEFYDGTSWTELNNLATGRTALDPGKGGSASAGIVFGGATPTLSNATEEWTAPDVVINTLTTS